jgi:hypothetical protein
VVQLEAPLLPAPRDVRRDVDEQALLLVLAEEQRTLLDRARRCSQLDVSDVLPARDATPLVDQSRRRTPAGANRLTGPARVDDYIHTRRRPAARMRWGMTSVESAAEQWARFRAYGNQLVDVHIRLRDQLDDLRDGVVPDHDFAAHCLAFCAAVSRHHTAEDSTVFPLLAERFPELRDFLAALDRDHQVIAGILHRIAADPGPAELEGLAAILETHFRGEEKRLAGVLDAVGGELGPDPFGEGPDAGS